MQRFFHEKFSDGEFHLNPVSEQFLSMFFYGLVFEMHRQEISNIKKNRNNSEFLVVQTFLFKT